MSAASMERSRNALLLAIFAIPDPPDSVLVDRRVRAAVEGQRGSAAADGRDRYGSGEEEASIARLNRCSHALRTWICEEGASAEGLESSVADEARGGPPGRVHADRCLDASRDGKGEIAAAAVVPGQEHHGSRGAMDDGLEAGRRKLGCQIHEPSHGSKDPDCCQLRKEPSATARTMRPVAGIMGHGAEDERIGGCSRIAVEDGLGAARGKLCCQKDKTSSKISDHSQLRNKEPSVTARTMRPVVGITRHGAEDERIGGCSRSAVEDGLESARGKLGGQKDVMTKSTITARITAASKSGAISVPPPQNQHNAAKSEHAEAMTRSISTARMIAASKSGAIDVPLAQNKLDAAKSQPTEVTTRSSSTALNTAARRSGAASVSPAQNQLASSSVHASFCEYDPWLEILHCGGKVLSHPWRGIWEQNPLVFHDQQLVRFLPEQDEAHDITEIITEILNSHPGSIDYFRLDRTKWTGRETQLCKWVRKLSEKHAEEIVIINQGNGTELEFPLDELQSANLKRLRLGFFSLSNLDWRCFEYQNLDTLQLLGCSFDTGRLYVVVKACNLLSNLEIGLSDRNVTLYSKSLKRIQIWRSRMRRFTIECGTKLVTTVIGIVPKERHVSLNFSDIPLLQELEYLLLPRHKLEDFSWLKSLMKLKLGVKMANCSQRVLIAQYLQCTSFLQDLSVWRMDDIGPCEELDIAIDESLFAFSSGKCLRHLLTFMIEDFRGGAAEVIISRAAMKYAESLTKFSVCPCLNASEELVKKSFMALRSMDRASSECRFGFSG